MFAYPVGPHKDVRLLTSVYYEHGTNIVFQLLFLDRELAETLDPRDDRTSAVRSRLLNILLQRMRGTEEQTARNGKSLDGPPPSLPPIGGVGTHSSPPQQSKLNGSTSGFQLPPLSFDATEAYRQERQLLTPITERSVATSKMLSGPDSTISGQRPPLHAAPSTVHEEAHEPEQESNYFSIPFSKSPSPLPDRDTPTPPAKDASSGISRPSRENSKDGSRFNSNVTSSNAMAAGPSRGSTMDSQVSRSSPANIQLPTSPVSVTSDSRKKFLNTPERPNSPPSSILTSPHSIAESPAPSRRERPLSTATTIGTSSVLTSPYSPVDASPRQFGSLADPNNYSRPAPTSPLPPVPMALPTSQPKSTIRAVPKEEPHDLAQEAAGALYYMQQFEPEHQQQRSQARRVPTTISEDDDETSSESESSPKPSASRSPQPIAGPSSPPKSPPVRKSTPMAFERLPTAVSPIPDDRQSPASRQKALGRKPSGARAPATVNRRYTGESSLSSHHLAAEEEETQTDEDTDEEDQGTPPPPPPRLRKAMSPTSDDDADALAALSYLDTNDAPPTPPPVIIEPLKPRSAVGDPSSNNPADGSDASATYRSSFAPSKQAAERKAKAQAQQAAHHAATHKPGRANGKRKSRVGGAWNESSEEEEEEDDDDDDADSDAEPSPVNRQQDATPVSGGGVSSNASSRQTQGQAQNSSNSAEQGQYPHLRPPRTLPQIPGNRLQRECKSVS